MEQNPTYLISSKWSKDDDEKLLSLVDLYGVQWDKIVQYMGNRTEKMCKNRWSKLTSPEYTKGPWTEQEDRIIIQAISEGVTKWSEIAKRIPGSRIGKQCRERWYNHLSPELLKTPWSEKEDDILITAQKSLGNSWTKIAKQLPGRSENEVKNRWYSVPIQKRIRDMELERMKLLDYPFLHSEGDILEDESNNWVFLSLADMFLQSLAKSKNVKYQMTTLEELIELRKKLDGQESAPLSTSQSIGESEWNLLGLSRNPSDLTTSMSFCAGLSASVSPNWMESLSFETTPLPISNSSASSVISSIDLTNIDMNITQLNGGIANNNTNTSLLLNSTNVPNESFILKQTQESIESKQDTHHDSKESNPMKRQKFFLADDEEINASIHGMKSTAEYELQAI